MNFTAGIYFTGPESVLDRESGDEAPEWAVYAGDENGEPTGTVYRLRDYHRAETLAERMAADRNLEIIAEACAA